MVRVSGEVEMVDGDVAALTNLWTSHKSAFILPQNMKNIPGLKDEGVKSTSASCGGVDRVMSLTKAA